MASWRSAQTSAEILIVKMPILLRGNTGDIPDYVTVQAWSPNQGWSLPPTAFQKY